MKSNDKIGWVQRISDRHRKDCYSSPSDYYRRGMFVLTLGSSLLVAAAIAISVTLLKLDYIFPSKVDSYTGQNPDDSKPIELPSSELEFVTRQTDSVTHIFWCPKHLRVLECSFRGMLKKGEAF